MSSRLAVVMFLGIAVSGTAQERIEAKVCLSDKVTSVKAQMKNKVIVASIFRRIGVTLSWQDCREGD